MFSYVVRCVFDDRSAMIAFMTWLRDEHIAKVLAAGVESAAIVELDPTADLPHALEVRYELASRAAFEAYERDHAPRLRAEGLAFAQSIGLTPGHGIVMTRTTGVISTTR